MIIEVTKDEITDLIMTTQISY